MTDISPLLEANPNSIDVLFNMDPEDLTEEQITMMISEFRKQRETWQSAEKTKATKAKVNISGLDDLLKDL